jgi:hypothetical protein
MYFRCQNNFPRARFDNCTLAMCGMARTAQRRTEQV